MDLLRYVVVNVVGIVLRFFPWPCQTGLTELGRPGRDSPVFLTCNYRLTVDRVRWALRGTSAYLLVANSRGINVWCAATGGLLTNHDVLSALKTSGIEERVDHRRVVLPQLAATGIEAGVVARKAGWEVCWGPVYARDLLRFVERGQTKSDDMRQVAFPWKQRVEMAAAWAFPISVVTALILAVLWRQALVPSIFVVWGMSMAAFLSFPLYVAWLDPEARGSGIVLAGFVSLWVLLLCGYAGFQYLFGQGAWAEVLGWAVLTLVVLLVMGVDFLGTTPLYKSGLLEGGLLEVVLDGERCKGVGYCEDVCPRGCYEVDRGLHKATVPGAARCVRCGACIVQCPCDAIHFEDPKGGTIPPDTIRRFKLNLMGKRVVR